MTMSIFHRGLRYGLSWVESRNARLYDFRMKRQTFVKAPVLALGASVLMLIGCSTTESRIKEHHDLFASLSPRDQELVNRGEIRVGMSENAVWLAWGSPDQKSVGAMRGRQTATWLYINTSYPYPYHSYPYYGYGYDGYGGFGGVGVIRRHHHGRFVFYGDPFYDPFYYSYIPPSVSYPNKTVTFSNGRVISFQRLVSR
jgi:hypothetical protein